ncbi:uncharacterized protein LOC115626164 [Scaptodrosophila lebanonensis]|uniref:Uncharacterized protein LOC115626164 n=1 Tax=Drosophila lebanonensis TaxID=7225 RepID=A0A6J2TMP1_DROLE|nr:uncharacterized protein LOC115626164 [Scaptodrosophila lebanonensis]
MQQFCFLIAVAATLGSAAAAAAATPSVFSGGSQEYVVVASTVYPPLGIANGAGAAIDYDGLEFGAITPPSSGLEGIAPCSVSSPTISECIQNLIQTIAPQLKRKGLPEYNMNSIDPYYYERGIFRYANDGIQGGLLIKNMEINGISDAQINSVNANFTSKGFIIKLGAVLPQLRAGGYFKADVKFGGLRLVPKGPFNITIDNIKATILTDGHIEQLDNGHQRVVLHRLNANVNIGKTFIVANGILTDSNLNAMILNLVNQNLPEITRVGIPATREQWAPILVTHINKFFANVPVEKFLIE